MIATPGSRLYFILKCRTGLNFHVCVSGLSVTIRLLDPPLHEFLPEGNVEEIVRELCAETGANEEEALERVEKLAEVNPMLGFRGCRLVFCYSIHRKNQFPPVPDPFGCVFSLFFYSCIFMEYLAGFLVSEILRKNKVTVH